MRSQGWFAVSLNDDHDLQELRSLYEHLQAKILEMIEALDMIRESADYQIFTAPQDDETVIEHVVSAQREELEIEITDLKSEAERVAEEARELAGEMPF